MPRGSMRLEKSLSAFTHVSSPDTAFACGRSLQPLRPWVYRQMLAPVLALLKTGLSPENWL